METDVSAHHIGILAEESARQFVGYDRRIGFAFQVGLGDGTPFFESEVVHTEEVVVHMALHSSYLAPLAQRGSVVCRRVTLHQGIEVNALESVENLHVFI